MVRAADCWSTAGESQGQPQVNLETRCGTQKAKIPRFSSRQSRRGGEEGESRDSSLLAPTGASLDTITKTRYEVKLCNEFEFLQDARRKLWKTRKGGAKGWPTSTELTAFLSASAVPSCSCCGLGVFLLKASTITSTVWSESQWERKVFCICVHLYVCVKVLILAYR